MHRIFLVGGILLASTICCCGTTATRELINTQSVGDQTAITEETKDEEKPTSTFTITARKTEAITPTKEEEFISDVTMTVTKTSEPSHLQGLDPKEILDKFAREYNLECLGWTYGWNVWSDECITTSRVDLSYGFTVYSRNKNTVDFIEAGLIQFDNPTIDKITSYFEDVLELPYSGSSPEIVMDWIKTQIPNMDGTPGDIRNFTYSGINYRLYGNIEGMWLEIGEIEPYIEPP